MKVLSYRMIDGIDFPPRTGQFEVEFVVGGSSACRLFNRAVRYGTEAGGDGGNGTNTGPKMLHRSFVVAFLRFYYNEVQRFCGFVMLPIKHT